MSNNPALCPISLALAPAFCFIATFRRFFSPSLIRRFLERWRLILGRRLPARLHHAFGQPSLLNKLAALAASSAL
ncbi:MAG TPA: hypothetical protein VGL11_12160, partial [Candidatus Binatia bacterium]